MGRRPYLSARTDPEGLLGSRPPPDVPADWTALSVDGSHIDVDRHLPLRCHLINLGGCVITYGKDFGCQLFSEPALAVADADLYLRRPDDPSDEVLIAGPLLGALRTVLEVEHLADAVEQLPDDKPALALLDGTLAFWDLQRGTLPQIRGQAFGRTTLPDRLGPSEGGFHRPPPGGGRRAYTSRPRTTEGGRRRAPHGLRARATPTATVSAPPAAPTWRPATGSAGFDDRELFELVLAPGHRSPLYRSSRLAARFALGLATGQEWSHFYYLNGGAEIARVEAPEWLASDPEPLALSHAMLVKQCQLGLGLSRGRLRGPRAGHHHRPRSCRVPPHDPHAPGTARPACSGVRQGHIQAPALGPNTIFPPGRSPARWSGFSPGGQSDRRPSCRRKLPSNARTITHKKSQAPMEGRRLAGVRYRLGHSPAGTPNAGWRPGRQLCLFSGRP